MYAILTTKFPFIFMHFAMLAPITRWLTDLSLLRFDMDWLRNPDLRRPHSLEGSDIPEEDKVIIKGLHRRQSLAENPSEKDLKHLEDAYTSKLRQKVLENV